MSLSPSFYDLLGLSNDATTEEIRRAYHDCALRYHPDRNPDQEALEEFLQIQKAYEVLSNLQARKEYDRELAEHNAGPVQVEILYGNPALTVLDEPQLTYALLTFSPHPRHVKANQTAVNIGLVVDRSTSMQGTRLDMVKDATIELLRAITPSDRFSITTFSDRAEVLLPASNRLDRRLIENQILMIRASGGTEMYQGLEMGVAEVERAGSRSMIKHVFLITDGRTYGDEAACLRLAEQCGGRGVQITGLGIGTEWNDVFLDKLSGLTGGVSFFIEHTGALRGLLKGKLESLRATFADQVVLNVQPSAGVKLVSAYRVSPEPFLMAGESALRLGSIPLQDGLSILLEFQVGPILARSSRFQIAAAELAFSLPADSSHRFLLPIRLSRPTSDVISSEMPPRPIFQALARLNLYRMQERARYDISVGKVQQAGERLKRLATELLGRGEVELARTAIMEAERIQQTQMLSAKGEKQIKYGTRALLPAPKPRNADSL